MEVVVTAGAIRRTELQSNRHHQQTSTQLFTGRMPCLSPNQQCQSTERKFQGDHLQTPNCGLYTGFNLVQREQIAPGPVFLLGLGRGKACPPETDDDVTAVGNGDEFL